MSFTFVVVTAVAIAGTIIATQQRIEGLQHRHARIVLEAQIDQIVPELGGVAFRAQNHFTIAAVVVIADAVAATAAIIRCCTGAKGISSERIRVGWAWDGRRERLLRLGGRAVVQC